MLALLVGTLALNALRLAHFAPQRPAARYAMEAHRLALAPGHPAASWIEAVRSKTPADTILIAPETPLPLSILAGRPEYIALWPARRARAGYTIDPGTWIVDALGASRPAFDRRRALHRRVYDPNPDTGDHEALIEALGALGRPVAIRFPSGENELLATLRGRALGEAIFAEREEVVWLIDFDDAGGRDEP